MASWSNIRTDSDCSSIQNAIIKYVRTPKLCFDLNLGKYQRQMCLKKEVRSTQFKVVHDSLPARKMFHRIHSHPTDIRKTYKNGVLLH